MPVCVLVHGPALLNPELTVTVLSVHSVRKAIFTSTIIILLMLFLDFISYYLFPTCFLMLFDICASHFCPCVVSVNGLVVVVPSHS